MSNQNEGGGYVHEEGDDEKSGVRIVEKHTGTAAFQGELSEKMIPRAVFVLETHHSLRGGEEIKKDMRARLGGLSEEAIENLFARVTAKLTEAGALGGLQREYHTLALVEDKEKNTVKIVVQQGHTHPDGQVHVPEVARVLDEEPNSAVQFALLYAAYSTLAIQVAYDPDWKGTRQAPIELEAETYAEMISKLQKAGTGIYEAFTKLVPCAPGAPGAPVAGRAIVSPLVEAEAAPRALNAQEQKVLEKRYGKKAIALLKKRIAGAKGEGG